jgi:hypothetical protein
MVKNLEAPDGYWHLRLPHLASIVQVVERVTSAIAYSRARQIPGLLVDVTGVSPLIAPTLVDRFLMVETWAFASKGDVAVAVVAQPAHIHPTKFGVKLANDLGWKADVFVLEREALEWLLAQNDLEG